MTQALTTEQNYFLGVLSDYLNHRLTKSNTILDWEYISSLASIHQVMGIFHKQCTKVLPSDYQADFLKSYIAGVYYYSNRLKMLDEIAAKFEESNIPFYTVKGMNVAALYPVPALRTMGDCDIVVHSDDRQKVHSILLSLGYRNTQQGGMEWTYYKNDMEFEIHDRLLYDEEVNSELHKDFTELAWEYTGGDGCRKQLDWSFHFIFLLLHLKKHLMNQGVGFRQFMDLAVVMQRIELNWDWIIEKLDELQLHQFFDICCSLIYRWFETEIPVAFVDIDDNFYIYATQYVFNNGVFGFDNEDNKENAKLNHLTEKSGPRWLIRVRFVIGCVFPSYEAFRYVPHYSFVNNRPWLLPAAWIYRWYRAIRYRMTDSGIRMIDNAMISNEKLDARKAELRKWGL